MEIQGNKACRPRIGELTGRFDEDGRSTRLSRLQCQRTAVARGAGGDACRARRRRQSVLGPWRGARRAPPDRAGEAIGRGPRQRQARACRLHLRRDRSGIDAADAGLADGPRRGSHGAALCLARPTIRACFPAGVLPGIASRRCRSTATACSISPRCARRWQRHDRVGRPAAGCDPCRQQRDRRHPADRRDCRAGRGGRRRARRRRRAGGRAHSDRYYSRLMAITSSCRRTRSAGRRAPAPSSPRPI